MSWNSKIFFFSFLILCWQCSSDPDQDWPMYSADPFGTKYSQLIQINVDNIQNLELAWTYSSGDNTSRSTIECNPIIVDGVMYLSTPSLRAVALDAANGKEIWSFQPQIQGGGVNRGLVHYSDETGSRVFFVKGPNLYALDAQTGEPINTFGDAGVVNLKKGLGRNVDHLWVTAATPGIIYQDLLIMGTTLGEGPGPAAPGHIRAYNVLDGTMMWIFHTIPQPGEFGYETWPADSWLHIGGTNAWGGFTLDEDRGLVFCGTGSGTYDHYGGNRKGENLFANCILALDAATGTRKWHFQVVHHDIWDYDIPCPPNLVQVQKDGQLIDALAQPTKMGHLFVLDRENGMPLFEVEEVTVPASRIEGEHSWPTQPFPPPGLRYAGQHFSEQNVSNHNAASTDSILQELAQMQTGDIFLPPGVQPSVMLPQFNGGTDWGGAAFDPVSRTLYINCSNEAEWISMVKATADENISVFDYGQNLFKTHCTTCHSPSISTNPELMSIKDLRDSAKLRSTTALTEQIKNGKGQMPGFGFLLSSEVDAVIAFLQDFGHENLMERNLTAENWSPDIPYVATGHNEFKDPEGFPVNRPPWGMLSAIDLDAGKIKWQVPLGTYPELEKRGLPPTGTFNMGGPLITAGGLIFIGAAMDERFHAYDSHTGDLLWQYQMDAGGYATPATYSIKGKQFVIIAAGGGGKPGTRSGDKYYCFTLPSP